MLADKRLIRKVCLVCKQHADHTFLIIWAMEPKQIYKNMSFQYVFINSMHRLYSNSLFTGTWMTDMPHNLRLINGFLICEGKFFENGQAFFFRLDFAVTGSPYPESTFVFDHCMQALCLAKVLNSLLVTTWKPISSFLFIYMRWGEASNNGCIIRSSLYGHTWNNQG